MNPKHAVVILPDVEVAERESDPVDSGRVCSTRLREGRQGHWPTRLLHEGDGKLKHPAVLTLRRGGARDPWAEPLGRAGKARKFFPRRVAQPNGGRRAKVIAILVDAGHWSGPVVRRDLWT